MSYVLFTFGDIHGFPKLLDPLNYIALLSSEASLLVLYIPSTRATSFQLGSSREILGVFSTSWCHWTPWILSHDLMCASDRYPAWTGDQHHIRLSRKREGLDPGCWCTAICPWCLQKMQILILPCMLIPAQTCTFVGCLALHVCVCVGRRGSSK